MRKRRNRRRRIWKAVSAIGVIVGIIASGIKIYEFIYPSIQNITINIYYPPSNQPPLEPNIPQRLPSPLPLGFHASQLFKGAEGRLHFNLTSILKNDYAFPVTIGWVYLRVVNVTYVDGSFEKWSVSNNATINQKIESDKYLYIIFGISEYGFEKEPKVVNLQIQIHVSDPASVRSTISGPITLERKV